MRLLSSILLGVAALFGALAMLPQGASAERSDVSHGRYLVMNAGKCTDCHGAKLQGMHLGFMAPHMPIEYDAPKIAGLPQLSQAAAARFLQTGRLPNGSMARPPMPQFRFNRSDAMAIAAYLKSMR
ncbi:MAG: cytochrome c [Candidatus Eremiobacteraeota bacterium]|nr:cytochrome c [Candidatus Eremiobacteraeota bacterium]MBC5827283.1 cytochrome c [Candidatus Eremiobacteraeota bacterium]